jgi:hypothetical protein
MQNAHGSLAHTAVCGSFREGRHGALRKPL